MGVGGEVTGTKAVCELNGATIGGEITGIETRGVKTGAKAGGATTIGEAAGVTGVASGAEAGDCAPAVAIATQMKASRNPVSRCMVVLD